MWEPKPESASQADGLRQRRAAQLAALRERIGDCHRCALGDTRTSLVFGVGSPCARLMFIGEAPGRNEDLKGEPFVGAAGQFLDELLDSIGLARADVYIANILKCRPPNNRDPSADEVSACTPFLEEQIRIIDPAVLATLGNHATRYVLNTERPISAVRGRLFHQGPRCVVPLYHPAAALYDRTKADLLFDDFRRLKSVLEKAWAGSEGSEQEESDLSRMGLGRSGAADLQERQHGSSGTDEDFEQLPLFS